MRIAQVSPLYESVPPQSYGGTERVVSWLTEGLVALGHDVTLFASGDSLTAARLEPGSARSLRMQKDLIDPLAHHIVMLDKVAGMAEEFDLIHFHLDYMHFPLSRRLNLPNVSTLHGRLDIPDLQPLYKHFPEMPVISISDSQREPLPLANWQGTVYHGMPFDSLKFSAGPGKYLAFLGRTSPEKGLEEAIEIAKRAEMPLKIAAKVDRADLAYFESKIKPLLNHPLIEFIGEISHGEQENFLGGAIALVFPIQWQEPFGIVMIEAMACGTPIVAFNRGSVSEVMKNGVSGYVVRDIEGAVRAIRHIDDIDRAGVRQYWESRFTSARMVQDYMAIYDRIIDGRIEGPLALQGFSDVLSG